jgi:hypothetical protein
MQLVQQSALSFDKLDKGIQEQMLKMVDGMDAHAFQNAQESLRCQHEQRMRQMANANVGRKHVLVVTGALAGAALIAGSAITILLIQASQPQLAHTVMMSGMAVISALLGGAGFASLFKQLSGTASKE